MGGMGGGDAGSPPVGLVVVAGKDGTNKRVFATLDPATGKELKRYPISTAGIAYDGVADQWYIFEADNSPPLPTHPITLHVGTIDPKTGVWTEIKSTSNIPVLVSSSKIVVLNKRLVYAAWDPASDAGINADKGTAVLDTSNLNNIVPATFAPNGFAMTGAGRYMLGTRADPSAGGVINNITQTCSPGCTLLRQRLTIPNDPAVLPLLAASTNVAMIPATMNPGAISATATSERKGSVLDVLIYPDIAGQNGIISRFNPTAAMPMGADVTFPANCDEFTGAAVAECDDTIIVEENKSDSIYAVPLAANGVPAFATLNLHPATSVVFEPVTKTAITPFRLPTFELGAFQLGGTKTNPTLTVRTAPGWTPPTDLSVDTVAVRETLPINCP
jgi:hypothetical protein